MVPLGFAGFFFGPGAARLGALGAVLINALWTLGLSLLVKGAPAGFLSDTAFFLVLTLAFTWLVAPPLNPPAFLRIRAAYRLVLGALAGAAALSVWGGLADSEALIRSQAELIASVASASVEADAVRLSLVEQELSPERILRLFRLVQARGGLVASLMAVFFVNRQLALGLAAFVRRRRGLYGGEDRSLRVFHVPPRLIWVFSLSLGGILLFRVLGLSLPETAAWNVLTLCVLMYLAQGLGILRFFMGRQSRRPGRRLLLTMGIILAFFSPGINTIALGLLLLLGIAEHWAPLRVVRDRPPSTPAAGL
jgi:hypothetical protein